MVADGRSRRAHHGQLGAGERHAERVLHQADAGLDGIGRQVSVRDGADDCCKLVHHSDRIAVLHPGSHPFSSLHAQGRDSSDRRQVVALARCLPSVGPAKVQATRRNNGNLY